MIGFHGIGILFHGICISFRCISLHFMNFVTFRFMSSKRDFATDGAPYGKGALWKVAILAKMAYFAKMAEMAINRRNCQIINKNANEMAKGPFGK